MFTGIVGRVGSIASAVDTETGRRLVISAPDLGDVAVGGSISVNGVCLTAVDAGTDRVAVDVIPETLKRSNLGSLGPGAKVNLELAMPASGRFDGHIVQGHVDGVGTISAIDRSGDGGVVMAVDTPESLRRYLVEKGSVTIDGVSLTVAGITDRGFTVALIPHTLEETTLGLRDAGGEVNLEMDVLAKYVERLVNRP